MRTKETEDAERVRKRFEPNSTDNMLNDPLRFFAFSGSSVALGSNSSYSMQVSTGKQRGIGMARDERRMNPKSVRVDRRERKRAPRNFYVTCKDNGRILFDPGSSSIEDRRGKSVAMDMLRLTDVFLFHRNDMVARPQSMKIAIFQMRSLKISNKLAFEIVKINV